jgi:hypothetical protein
MWQTLTIPSSLAKETKTPGLSEGPALPRVDSNSGGIRSSVASGVLLNGRVHPIIKEGRFRRPQDKTLDAIRLPRNDNPKLSDGMAQR